MDLTKLKIIHQKIKNHPYRNRFDPELVNSYCDLLKIFLSLSIDILREFNKEHNIFCWGHFHDFNRAIGNLRYIKTPKEMPEEYTFIETVIAQFHNLIAYGEFTELSHTFILRNKTVDGVKINKGSISTYFYSKTYNVWVDKYENIDNFKLNKKYWLNYYKEMGRDDTEIKKDFEFIEEHFIDEKGELKYI
jgi:hypothetical protein